MKVLIAVSLLLAWGAMAFAKPTPTQRTNVALAHADINIGGAELREREYFEAPQPPVNSGNLYCRLEPVLFDKVLLAQSCR